MRVTGTRVESIGEDLWGWEVTLVDNLTMNRTFRGLEGTEEDAETALREKAWVEAGVTVPTSGVAS